MKKKIILLNPPGDRPYLRDYYCSKVSKTNYSYQSVDFVILSAILKEDFSLTVVDGITEKLSVDTILDKICSENPYAVIFLSGSVCWEQDFEFLKILKEKLPGTLLIGSADIFLESDVTAMLFNKYPFIDGAILDFTSTEIIDFLHKYSSGKSYKSIIYHRDGEVFFLEEQREFNVEFNIPVPAFELFKNEMYSYPFVRDRKFATILTEYGCPFTCDFCIMSSIGYKYRSVANIIEEMRYLKQSGINELYINDQTFGSSRNRATELLQRMIEEKFNFRWFCFSRLDIVDEEFMALMKKAGLAVLMFGVESAKEETQEVMNKNLTRDQISRKIDICDRLGIKTLGSFILGLPGETVQDMMNTLNFMRTLKLDFVSFNIYVPRIGTRLRRTLINENKLEEYQLTLDQSGEEINYIADDIEINELKKIHSLAIKKFYLNPRYIVQRMKSIRSFKELRFNISSFFWLLKIAMKK